MRFKHLVAFALLAIPYGAYADSLTIHLIRSPSGMDWSSPASVTKSTLFNAVETEVMKKSHSIGHTFVEVTCEKERSVHFLAGATSTADVNDKELLFTEGYGLGMMLYRVHGFLESTADLSAERDLLAQKEDRLSFVRFEISPSTCARLSDYYEQYQARGYDKTYSGLDADPLKGEGSGCAAYSWSFLRVGGLVLPELEKEWRRKLSIPNRWVGGPLTGKKISVWDIVRTKDAWLSYGDGTRSEESTPIDFVDLDQADAWVRARHAELGGTSAPGSRWPRRTTPSTGVPNLTMKAVTIGKAPGLAIDLSNLTTPTGNIFLVP